MDTDVSMLSNDASMIVASVTPNRMLSPETSMLSPETSMLPPPAPYKRRIFSMEEDLQGVLPLFPDLSGESMMDDSVASSSPSIASTHSLAMRIDEDDGDMDMLFFTPYQPRQHPLSIEDIDTPKFGIKPKVTVQCHCQPLEKDSPPMLPALNPQDDSMSCTKVPIQLKLRSNFVEFTPRQKVTMTACTA
jgi:hypothetical protein